MKHTISEQSASEERKHLDLSTKSSIYMKRVDRNADVNWNTHSVHAHYSLLQKHFCDFRSSCQCLIADDWAFSYLETINYTALFEIF